MPTTITAIPTALRARKPTLNAPKRARHPTDVHVGGRIREARMAAGMSQEKLSEPLKITFQQVQKYENGSNHIAPSRLEQVARLVKRPVAWFFEGLPSEGATNAPDAVHTFAQTRDGYAFAVAFNEIADPNMRSALLAMAQAAARAKAGTS